MHANVEQTENQQKLKRRHSIYKKWDSQMHFNKHKRRNLSKGMITVTNPYVKGFKEVA